MIKIIAIDKIEPKQFDNGDKYMSYHAKVQTDDGGQVMAYISVFGGANILVGDNIECQLKSMVSKKSGNSYWAGNYKPNKPVGNVPKSVATSATTNTVIARSGYTVQQLDELMLHCINIGKNNAGDVEGCSAIINSLFIAMTNNGCKVVNDPVEMVKDIMEGTDFNAIPVEKF